MPSQTKADGMAVHIITLDALKTARAARPPAPSPPPSAPPAPHMSSVPQPPADTPVAFSDPDEPGLGLSPHEISTLVEQSGDSGGKALLSLILRISSLEAQIADLRARVATGPSASPMPQHMVPAPAPRPPSPAPAAPRPAPAAGSGKDGILEQIFNNNLALWQSLEDEEESPNE